jgi:uncharacterized membrane protein YeiH
MTVLSVLDYIGVFAFSISGILAASEKQLDLFGGIIIAFVTALGGGTLRDVLLNTDISWMQDNSYIYVATGGAFFAVVFKKAMRRIRKTLFLFDTIGIALFTILGLQKALAAESTLTVAAILAVISATFGGVIRDILCNDIPLIFRKEIYATACLAGAALYIGLTYTGMEPLINLIISGSLIVSIRVFAVVKKLRMPLLNEKF